MLEVLVLLGGLTTHPFSPEKLNDRYKNVVGKHGAIVNPYASLMIGSSRFKTGMIYGTDSVGGTIYGSISHFKFNDNIGLVFGGYNYNKKEFEARKMVAPNYFGITPVLGVDVSFKLYKGDKFTIESHNVLSIITTHSIGIKFDF